VIEISPEMLIIVMFGSLVALAITGFPIAFVLAGIGLVMGFLIFGLPVFEMFRLRSYSILANFSWLAVPLFIFMGSMVQTSGVAEKLYNAIHVLMGRVRGGMAIGTITLGTILAACVGNVAASVITMGLLAMPAMLKRGYDKSLAAGAVCAGGSLGILIPPSVMLVFYGPIAGLSVGKLFMAAFPAGLLLSGLYITYLVVRCLLQKNIAPTASTGETDIPLIKKLSIMLFSLLPPFGLILAVLGSIFFGIATPTEAAGVGSLASIVLAASYRRLTWTNFRSAAVNCVRVTCMAVPVAMGAAIFTGVFDFAGGGEVIHAAVLGTPLGKWGIFAIIMVMVFILGMFIDWIGILFIMVPIITPIGKELGFDPLWFAMMIIINLQLSFITPPFAYAIFFLSGIAKPEWELSSAHIIRGIIPYVGLIGIGLGLCVIFPEIILWLPSKMIR